MPTLTADLREQKGWIDAFRAFSVSQECPKGWTVEARIIEVGDYAVGSDIGIEHKAPPDFLNSLASGRLFAQAQELAGAYRRAYIVVDGDHQALLFDRWNRIGAKATRGAIASLAGHFGVPVLFCGPSQKNPALWANSEFVRCVFALAEKSQGESSFHYSPLRRKASGKERGAHLLGGLEGIGQKRAQAIIAHYGSPLRALNDWRNWHEHIDGIGDKTTERVGKVLEPAPDGEEPPQDG